MHRTTTLNILNKKGPVMAVSVICRHSHHELNFHHQHDAQTQLLLVLGIKHIRYTLLPNWLNKAIKPTSKNQITTA